MGLLQMAVLIIVGALLFKVNWGNSPLALAMVVVSFGLAAVAMGVMLGAFAKTRSQARNLTIMFSMMMAALGGAWWQLEVTPPLYQKIVQIFAFHLGNERLQRSDGQRRRSDGCITDHNRSTRVRPGFLYHWCAEITI